MYRDLKQPSLLRDIFYGYKAQYFSAVGPRSCADEKDKQGSVQDSVESNAASQEISSGSASSPAYLKTNLSWQLALLIFCLCCAALLYTIDGYHAAFAFINSGSSSIPTFLLHIITSFGDGTFLLALILLLCPRHKVFHCCVLFASLLGGIFTNVIKKSVAAYRPPLVLDPDSFTLVGRGYEHQSFPSGHTLTAFLLASLCLYFCPRMWQKLLCLSVAILVGLSRVWHGIHWPIDALVGAALGLLAGGISIYIVASFDFLRATWLHLLTLFLLFVASLLLVTQKYDYTLALPVLIPVGIAALVRASYIYLIPQGRQWAELAQGQKLFALVQAYCSYLVARPLLCLAVLICVVTLYRWWVITQAHFDLFYDEAYYYHWSLFPDFGYYSKPPMVAWFITLGSSLFGPSIFGIKCMATLAYSVTAVVLYFILRAILQDKFLVANTPSSGGAASVNRSSDGYALLGSCIFLAIPLIGFNSVFITTDAPLLLFWSSSLLVFIYTLQKPSLPLWCALGVLTGLGMLSKYTMAALPLGIFIFLLTDKKYRALLTTAGPWIAAVIAGALFSLNLYWNYQHDWIAFAHTKEISQTSGKLFNFPSLFEFLFTQLIIFGPVWSIAFFRFAPSLGKSGWAEVLGQAKLRVVLYPSLVMLAIISTQAFLSRAFANWAAPWVIGGTISLVVLMRQQTKFNLRPWLATGFALHLALLSSFYHWPMVLEKMEIPLSTKTDAYRRVAGWQALGEQLASLKQEYPKAIVASQSRDLLAYLGYYSDPKQRAFARWQADPENIRDYYDLKMNLRDWEGSEQAFVFISKTVLDSTTLAQFDQAEFLGTLQHEVYPGTAKSVEVYWLKGFRGYPK